MHALFNENRESENEALKAKYQRMLMMILY